MKQEVIQDFLNLPGIAGIALMDGRSRPCFYGLEATLNRQQKEALSQGILQVVGTIPNAFEGFEFQFTTYQVYIYKLAQGMILLVIAERSVAPLECAKAVKRLRTVLQSDVAAAIASLRSATGTLSDLIDPEDNVLSPLSALTAPEDNVLNHPEPAPINLEQSDPLARLPSDHNLDLAPSPPLNPALDRLPKVVAEPAATLQELLAILNHLSQFTTHYLGTAVVANYFKTTRPSGDLASYFQVDRTAQITFSSLTSRPLNQPVSREEHQWIQAWVVAFIKRCSQIIRDFASLVKQTGLSDHQKALLFQDLEQ